MPIDFNWLTDGLPPEAFDFFAIFSRFEYALKRAGYMTNDKDATPDWNSFSKDLGKEFFASIEGSGNASTLIASPPAKQVNKDRLLDWETKNKVNNTQDLLGMVRRVRNNLFHGGKYPFKSIGEPSRDQDLLRQAIFVLQEAANSTHKQSEKFRGLASYLLTDSP